MVAVMNLTDVAYLLYPATPLNVLSALARMHGRLLYLTRRSARTAVRENLSTLLETSGVPGDLDQMTRSFFEYRQLRMLLLTLVHRLPAGEQDRLFPIEGEERVDEALTAGKGAIMMGSHVNSVCAFLAVYMLRQHGFDVRVAIPTRTFPYDRSPFRKMIDRIFRFEGAWMDDGFFYAQFNVRPILRALEENAIVLLIGDGWHSASFVEVGLLGRRMQLTTGPIGVGVGAGVPILPLFTVGEPPDRLRFLIERRLQSPTTKLSNRQITASMVEEYARRLDVHVRNNLPCLEYLSERNSLRWMENPLEESLIDRYNR